MTGLFFKYTFFIVTVLWFADVGEYHAGTVEGGVCGNAGEFEVSGNFYATTGNALDVLEDGCIGNGILVPDEILLPHIDS